MDLHDLTAAYALDALEPSEAHEYERHLPTCERCRRELAELQEAAGALAIAVDAPPPPPHLRERVLEQVRGERTNVVPLRRNRPFQWAAAGIAAAAAAAVVLAFWSASLSGDLDRERAAFDEIAALVADPAAERVPVEGARGTLVVAPSGKAALVVDLEQAPTGKTYEAWVIEGEQPIPAGLFDADDGRAAVVLEQRVREGAVVAVTLEDDGGVEAPTSEPVLTAAAA